MIGDLPARGLLLGVALVFSLELLLLARSFFRRQLAQRFLLRLLLLLSIGDLPARGLLLEGALVVSLALLLLARSFFRRQLGSLCASVA